MYGPDQIQRVLDKSGVFAPSDNETHIVVFCPFHHNVNTPAGEIDKSKGLFYCFSCKHTTSFEDYLAKATGMTYFQALRMVAKFESKESLTDEIAQIMQPAAKIEPVDKEFIKAMSNLALTTDRALDYYHGRGITTESIQKHMFGYSPKQDMIIMPYMSPTGDCFFGFEGRSIEGKRFKAHGPKTQTLFNLNNVRWSNDVFITESIIDSVLIEQAGFSAVARMGTGSGTTQVSLLERYFNRVYIVQDNDGSSNGFAGQSSAQKLLDKLGRRGIIVVPPQGYKDIGEMPIAEIKTFLTGEQDITKGLK